MKHAWMLFFSLALLAAICSPSHAQYTTTWHADVTVLVEDFAHNPLGSMAYVGGGTINSAAPLPQPLTIKFSLVPDGLWGDALFENINLLSNVGKTIWVSSGADDISFNEFVYRLTDGRNSTMWGLFSLNSHSGTIDSGMVGHSESSYLGNCYPDFGDWTIGRIGLRIDDAWITQGLPDVPEPGALVSLLCGIVGLCGFASRRRKTR
jgi:hypothetical protein